MNASQNLSFVRKIFRLLSPKEALFVWSSILIRFFLISLDLVGIFLIGAVVSLLSGTVISKDSNFGQLITWISSLGIDNVYAPLLGIAIAFFIAKGFLSVTINRITAMYLAQIEWRKSVEAFSKIFKLKLDKLEVQNKQDLMHAVSDSAAAATTKTILLLSIVSGEVFLLTGISALLAMTNLVLYLEIAMFFLVVGYLMNRFISRSAGRTATEAQRTRFASQRSVLDLIDNFRVLSLSPNAVSYVGNFSKSRQKFAYEGAKYQNITSLPRYITEISVLLATVILVIQRAFSGADAVAASTVAIFLTGIFRIVSSMVPLQSALSSWSSISHEAESFLKISLANASKVTVDETQVQQGPLPIIVADNLSYSHNSEKFPTLNKLNFSFPPGKFVAIAGKSGAGKSTLADLIAGLREPTGGSLKIGGIPAAQFVQSHPGKLAYVPQQTRLISGTLRENISLNFSSQSGIEDKIIVQSLESAGLPHLLNNLPLGLDTKLGDGALLLSGGETQRIGIARALYLSPKVVIFDESTSALDSKTQDEILKTITKLKGKMTIIVIAHRPEIWAIADIAYEIK